MKIHRATDKLLHLTFEKASEAEPLVTCEHCGLTFHSSNSTEEALADFQREFPGEQEATLVCDSCYEKFIATLKGSSLSN